MRKLIVSLFFFVAVIGIASAQDTRPKTSSGDKALLFSFNGFGDFGVTGAHAGNVPFSFFGLDSILQMRIMRPVYGFGIKFYLADNVALRGSLGLGSSTTSTPRANDTTGKTDDVTDLVFGINPGLEFHLVNAGPVTAYTGVFVNYTGSWNFSGDEADTLVGTTTRSFSSFGGGAIFGVEYFPWSAVSLAAEYQLGVAATSTSTDRKGVSTDGPSYLDIGIGTFAVTLGVYF